MWKRNSIVKNVHLKVAFNGSIVEIGDVANTKLQANVLAVQKRIPDYYTDEFDLNAYPIFKEPIPIPPITASPRVFNKHNENPNICVGNIQVIGLSTSGMLQVGSANHINQEARVLHIRVIK